MEKVVGFKSNSLPDSVLEAAKGEFKDVLILGYTDEGHFLYRASAGLQTASRVGFLVDTFKHNLLMGDFSD
jgi:hypothetical protein